MMKFDKIRALKLKHRKNNDLIKHFSMFDI